MDVMVLVWDPIMGRLGRVCDWVKANTQPLSAKEAKCMYDELLPCVDDYHGQGLALHGVRVT